MPATKTTKTKQLPDDPNIRLDLVCNVGKPLQAAVDELHADACQFEADVSELHERRAELLRRCRETTLGELLEAGAEMSAERDRLTDTQYELRQQRCRLMSSCVEPYTAHLAAMTRELRDGIVAEKERLAALGIDASCMPAGMSNPHAAELQLHHKVLQSEAILPIQRKVNEATVQLDAAKNAASIEHRRDGCAVRFRPSSDRLENAVAELIGARFTPKHDHEVIDVAGRPAGESLLAGMI